jgi:hypothetical protein
MAATQLADRYPKMAVIRDSTKTVLDATGAAVVVYQGYQVLSAGFQSLKTLVRDIAAARNARMDEIIEGLKVDGWTVNQGEAARKAMQSLAQQKGAAEGVDPKTLTVNLPSGSFYLAEHANKHANDYYSGLYTALDNSRQRPIMTVMEWRAIIAGASSSVKYGSFSGLGRASIGVIGESTGILPATRMVQGLTGWSSTTAQFVVGVPYVAAGGYLAYKYVPRLPVNTEPVYQPAQGQYQDPQYHDSHW